MSTVKVIVRKTKGGSGSGNWGHQGIPGHQGGSASGGGSSGYAVEGTLTSEMARETRAKLIYQRMGTSDRKDVHALQKSGKSLADAVDEVFKSSRDKSTIARELSDFRVADM